MTIYTILFYKDGVLFMVEHFKNKNEMFETYFGLQNVSPLKRTWDDYDYIVGVLE